MKTRLKRQHRETDTHEPASEQSASSNATPIQTHVENQQSAPPVEIQMQRATQFGYSLGNFTVQPALAVGTPGDKYEQEADAVAAQAVSEKRASETDAVQAKTAPGQSSKTSLQRQSEVVAQRQSSAVATTEELDAQLEPMPEVGNVASEVSVDIGGGGDGGGDAGDAGGSAGGDSGGGAVGGGAGAGDMGGDSPDTKEMTEVLGGASGELTNVTEGDAGGEGNGEGSGGATPPANPGSEGPPSEEEQAFVSDIFSPETENQFGEAVGADSEQSSDSGSSAEPIFEPVPDPTSSQAVPSLEERILNAIASGGQSPTEEEQSSLNTYIGIEDPSNIEIHDNQESYQLCRELGALAFATENHIFFGEGQRGDDELLFHEAWHTVQQGAMNLEVRAGDDETVGDDDPPIALAPEQTDLISAHLISAHSAPNGLSLPADLPVQQADSENSEDNAAAEKEQKDKAGDQADNAGEQGQDQGDAAEDGAGSAEKDGAGQAQDAVGSASEMVAEVGKEGDATGAAPVLDPTAMVKISDVPAEGAIAEASLDEADDQLEAEDADVDPFDYSWVATQPEDVPEWDEEIANYSLFTGVTAGGEPEPPEPEVDREELIADAVSQGFVSGAVDGGINAVTALGVGAIGNKMPVVNNALATFTVVNQMANGESWYNALAGGKWADDVDAISGAADGLLSAKTPWEAIANYFAGIIGITNIVTKVVQFIWNIVNIAAFICFVVFAILKALDLLFTLIGQLLANIGYALMAVGNALLPLPFGVGVAPGTALISAGTTLINIGNQMWMYALTVFNPWSLTFKGFYDTLNGFLAPLSVALVYLQSLLVFLNLMHMQALVLDILTCEGSVDDLAEKQTALRDSTNAMTTNAFNIGTELAAQRTQGKEVGAGDSFASGGENAWLAQLPVVGDYAPGGESSLSGMAGEATTGLALGAEEGKEEAYQESWIAHYSKDSEGDQDSVNGYRSAIALREALEEAGEPPVPPMDAPDRVDVAAYALAEDEAERLALTAAIERAEEEQAILQESDEGHEAADSTVAANRAAITAYQEDMEDRQETNRNLGAEAGAGAALAAQYLALMAVYWPLLIPINLAFFFVVGIQGANQNVDETKGDNAINTQGGDQNNPEQNVSGNAGSQQQAGKNMGSAADATQQVADARIAKLEEAEAEATEHDAELAAMQAQFEQQRIWINEDRESLAAGQAIAEEELANCEDNQAALLAEREDAIGEAQAWEEEFGAFYEGVMAALGWDDGEADLAETDGETASDGVGLSGADLSEADLSEADLSEADLSEADLSGADLSGADLSNAILVEALLIGADLSGADLSDADISEADLSEADLSEAVLVSVNS